ncbi:hemagglutinin repeat-containing protein [Comamonas sp. E6]|uniref:hemagglutinin repeat-containing protein n=1 Tax=Comamonas sp. E6 TaxID=364029 RepID=UPI000635DC6B|nr:adhesin [Comamonas sp. E6]
MGGNLGIESLQDSSSYASRNQSVGGSLTISPAGVPIGGGLNAGQSKVNSNYQSVTEQSGIQAGDGGFQVSVKGDTDLKGAVVSGKQVVAEVGGNLNIESLQDSSNYASRNQSAGGSLTISPVGVPIGGGLNAGRSKVSNYRSLQNRKINWRMEIINYDY